MRLYIFPDVIQSIIKADPCDNDQLDQLKLPWPDSLVPLGMVNASIGSQHGFISSPGDK